MNKGLKVILIAVKVCSTHLKYFVITRKFVDLHFCKLIVCEFRKVRICNSTSFSTSFQVSFFITDVLKNADKQ